MLGVVGIWALFVVANSLVELCPLAPRQSSGPGCSSARRSSCSRYILSGAAVGTIVQSFTEVPEGEGPFYNYVQAFTDPALQIALRNNVIWLILAPAGAVLIGLAFAGLVDRVKRESLAKSFIFIPLCISVAGVAVIWRFIYEWRPQGQPQIGLLNAIVTAFGGEPVALAPGDPRQHPGSHRRHGLAPGRASPWSSSPPRSRAFR